jgi:hypothetical protein
MKELRWFGGLLLVFFALWLFGGGYERYSKENDKPFIKPPAPLDTGEVYGPTNNTINTKVPPGWQSATTDYFTIALPPGWYYKPSPSSIWNSNRGEFTDTKTVLFFEYGPYAAIPIATTDSAYIVTTEQIAGVSAKLFHPKLFSGATTGVFIDQGVGKEKLSIAGYNLTATEQNMAYQIFRTVEFRY